MRPCLRRRSRRGDPDLRRRGARPKRLSHQRQLLLAGPATTPFGLRQNLRHRFYGHLKRGRKRLLNALRHRAPTFIPAPKLRKAAAVQRLPINRYLAETNQTPKPFTWTADPDAIIEKVRRGKQALESIR
jgi:hypothetical protein